MNSSEKRVLGITALLVVAVLTISALASLGVSWLVLNALVAFGVMSSYTSAQFYWGAVIWWIISSLFMKAGK